jgi:trigger factor
LKIETQIQEDHQAKLTVEVEEELLEGAKKRAARKIASRVKIPGFRQGKAPYSVIARQVGDGAILEEAIEILINDIYPKVIEDANIQPYGPGKLDNMASLEPLVLEFLVPLKAEVTLGDYRSITKSYELTAIPEKDVDDVLKNLQERQALVEPVERAASPGDVVSVILSAKRTKVEEGQSEVLIREQSFPIIVLDSEEMPDSDEEPKEEWPFHGFSKNLIGLVEGDQRTFVYSYGENTSYEYLRGVEAEFSFVVENVKSRTLPDLDDDFAASVGEYENLEALRQEIWKSLEKQAENVYHENYDEEVLQEATNVSSVKFPPQMLEQEIDSVIENLKNRLQQQKLDIDLYLKSRDMDLQALRDEAKPVAETRLKKSLVLMQIAEAEKIEVAPDELQSETISTMNSISRMMSKDEVQQLNNRNFVQNLTHNVMMDLIARKATERLRMIASGKFVEEEVEQIVENVDDVDDVDEVEIVSDSPVTLIEVTDNRIEGRVNDD